MRTMNIYAREGDKVVYAYPNNGYTYQHEKNNKFLKVGETYTVAWTDVHQSSTDVYLQEFPGEYFNSVIFANAESENDDDDVWEDC